MFPQAFNQKAGFPPCLSERSESVEEGKIPHLASSLTCLGMKNASILGCRIQYFVAAKIFDFFLIGDYLCQQ